MLDGNTELIGPAGIPPNDEPPHEVDLTWNIIWEGPEGVPEDESGDWCHANSATVDIKNDAVYLSCRWLGLFKTIYKNPELQYHMPAIYHASGEGDVPFSPPESW